MKETTFCLLPASSCTYPQVVLPNNFKINLSKLEDSELNNLRDFRDISEEPPAKKSTGIRSNIPAPTSAFRKIGYQVNFGDDARFTEACNETGNLKEIRVKFPKLLPLNGAAVLERIHESETNLARKNGANLASMIDEYMIPADCDFYPHIRELWDADRDRQILDTVHNVNSASDDCKELSTYLFSVNGNNGPVSPLTSFPMATPASTEELVRPIGITWAPNATMEPKMCLDRWTNAQNLDTKSEIVGCQDPQNYVIPPVDRSFMQQSVESGSSTWSSSVSRTPADVSDSLNATTHTPVHFATEGYPNQPEMSYSDSSGSYCNGMQSATSTPGVSANMYNHQSPSAFYQSSQENAINLSQHTGSPSVPNYNASQSCRSEYVHNIPDSYPGDVYAYPTPHTNSQLSQNGLTFDENLLIAAAAQQSNDYNNIFSVENSVTGGYEAAQMSYQLSQLQNRDTSFHNHVEANGGSHLNLTSSNCCVENQHLFAAPPGIASTAEIEQAMLAQAAALYNVQQSVQMNAEANCFSYPQIAAGENISSDVAAQEIMNEAALAAAQLTGVTF